MSFFHYLFTSLHVMSFKMKLPDQFLIQENISKYIILLINIPHKSTTFYQN